MSSAAVVIGTLSVKYSMHLSFLLLSGTLYEMANSVDPDQTTPFLLKDLGLCKEVCISVLVTKLGVQTDLFLIQASIIIMH